MNERESSHRALYLWDYFYLKVVPRPEEAKPWRKIECATIRIRESEPYLSPKYPPAVRLQNAKRIRRATREIVSQIPSLTTVPSGETAEHVGYFAGLSARIISELQQADLTTGLQ